MCVHDLGHTELSLDRERGRLSGTIICDGCNGVIKRFTQFHYGVDDITSYRVNPNLRGNADYLGDDSITC